jgi:prolyl-tRNA synthetase
MNERLSVTLFKKELEKYNSDSSMYKVLHEKNIELHYDPNRKEMILQKQLEIFKLIRNIDALLDDRAERPGVLFADHDLIGIPHRFIVSERNLAQNKVEYKARTGKESQPWLMNEAVNKLASLCAIL